MGRRLLLAALLPAVFASSADAAEVLTVPRCVHFEGGCTFMPQARYTAAPGEANDLTIDRQDGVFVFRDGAGIAAGLGCAAAPGGAVACRAYEAVVDVGGGADRARSASPAGAWSLSIHGGPGDDDLAGPGRLLGGPGDDTLAGEALLGGDGDDALTGTSGHDRLEGGAGADTIAGLGGDDLIVGDSAVPATDLLAGGEGADTVDYRGRTEAVRVDLAGRSGGAAGEGDVLDGFERAYGGDGDDVLVGDEGGNRLDGELGRDTLVGNGGDDHLDGGLLRDVLAGGPGDDGLDGGHGLDRYSGGAGDDLLFMWGSHAKETLACGSGRDDVSWAGLALLLPSCERADGFRAYPKPGRGGSLTFSIDDTRLPALIELRVRGRRRPFSSARFVGNGRTVRVRLRVPPRIRRLRRSPLPIEVRILDPEDPFPGLRWVIDLPR